MVNMVESIEQQELIQKLIDSGYGQLVEALLYREGTFTRRNRLNKSGTCRVLGCKVKVLEDALKECRKILGDDIYS